ncbi:type II toxin-antitoxin system HipA family toxin [Bordetella sp. FB-8]|uniref:type II toxin-antitoxin system HipA family toxin n=1 Tax=Bordetella sp. FB-8 TaxID=1159870 RepID=UPI00037639F2|nr:type II toxin-antitoxin system HipA family toxin [Bordetella sp. FB-8]
MNVKALAIHLGRFRVGVLFQYAAAASHVVTRFVVDDAFASNPDQPMVSLSMLADDAQTQRALWADVRSPIFNGRYSPENGWLLPAFFQNLLPEGVFRDRVAELRGCDPKDHFEMLAACGRDLPGDLAAQPVDLTRSALARYVTQDADALEMTVTAEPLEEGISLSGVQPKLGVQFESGRYVGRTRLRDAQIIAKLPVVGQPLLPQLEALSLHLAEAAGVAVVQAHLEPLEKLQVEHGYDLGEVEAKTQFLAVTRYDRDASSNPAARVHCEDFAQILDVMPEQKNTGGTYLDVANIMMAFPSLGEPAVHELLRRLAVNEMLGNPDMHLKNIGVIYPDGRTPLLPPAYDIVAYAAYNKRIGHALHILPPDRQSPDRRPPDRRPPDSGRSAAKPKMSAAAAQAGQAAKPGLSPAVVREFCALLDIAEKPAAAAVRQAVAAAVRQWPAMIHDSGLTVAQKEKLLAHFLAHPLVASLMRRRVR